MYQEEDVFPLQKKMDGENLYMRNSSTSKVLDVGKVILKMTSKKLLTFNNILHVADIRKKLVFGSLQSKNGFKMVFKSIKFIISKSGMFVGKKYLCDDLFKINKLTIITNDENNNKIFSSSYLFESYDVWHSRLNHLNYNFMQRLTNHELLPRIIFEKKS
jgi:hypothetical protein